jgi:hypothetical protein
MSVRTRLEQTELQRKYAAQVAKTQQSPEEIRSERLRANADKIRQQNVELLLQQAEMTDDEREVLMAQLPLDSLASPDVYWARLVQLRAESAKIINQVLVNQDFSFREKVFLWMQNNATAAERLATDGGKKLAYARNLISLDE